MNFHIFPHSSSDEPRRAVLLFAGWGMDDRPFSSISLNGYRLIVVWDYRDPTLPEELFAELCNYDEIIVVAWSFGVPAATHFIAEHPELPVTARIAVNGTMHPVDDEFGIPTVIFNGTLDNLSEKTLSKFQLRMCGSAATFRKFTERSPLRSVDELRDELRTIHDMPVVAPQCIWDSAFVGLSDRIIPPENQRKAWETEASEIITIDGPHLPDFNSILSTVLTEKGLVANKFAKAESTYDSNATVQHDIALKLLSLLPSDTCTMPSTPLSAIEIGCATGRTSRMLASHFKFNRLSCWDLHIPADFPDSLPDVEVIETSECDAETEIRNVPTSSLDLIFSASTMQWFNSPATFMRECRRTLRNGGIAMLSTFGPDTMVELSDCLSNHRHYPTVQTIRRMIPAECELLHLSTETCTLYFPNPTEAIRHMRLTGVNALSSAYNPATVRRIINSYPLTASGEATVTYQPIYILFKKSN